MVFMALLKTDYIQRLHCIILRLVRGGGRGGGLCSEYSQNLVNSIPACAGPASTGLMQLPVHLPPNIVSAADLKLQYSLHRHEQQQEPLRGEVEGLVRWLTEKLQLDRQGPAVANRTKENIMKCVWAFLGFEQLHMNIASPSLTDFLNAFAFGTFVSFHLARGNTLSTITQYMTSARKVLSYLSSQGDEVLQANVLSMLGWLSNLKSQVGSVASLPRHVDAPLPPAHLVVRKIEQLRLRALGCLPPPGQSIALSEARLVHDACLACMMFSYLPPIRLVSLRTLQMPGTIGCLFQGCSRIGCRGNRLDLRGAQLTLLLNHYKVERRWETQAAGTPPLWT